MATSEAPGGFTGELTFGLDPESSVVASEGMWTCQERGIMVMACGSQRARVPRGWVWLSPGGARTAMLFVSERTR